MHKLLCNDSVMLIQPQLVKKFGRAGAQLLNQLHYWLLKKSDNWVYNTAEEWAEQLQLSVRHVRRLIAKFVNLGVIKIAKLSKIKTDRTNYYSIDYTCLHNLFNDKMSASLCQNDLISIQRLPNKDINKSEEFKKPAKEMMKIWNECLNQKVKLSQYLAPLLVAAFQIKFESSYDSWRNYCLLIKSSEYLMGKNFTLTLGWALKFATIERIQAYDFGVKAEIQEDQPDHNIKHLIDNLNEPDASKTLRKNIVKAIGDKAYYSWFHSSSYIDNQLKAPNPFVEQYWETHFANIERSTTKTKNPFP